MIKLVVNTRDSDVNRLITAQFFDDISISLKFDSVTSTFSFKMFFDPDDATLAELTAVSHIHECQIFYVHDQPGTYATKELNGKPFFEYTTDELIITGFMLNQLTSNAARPGFIEIGGYSKAGILGKCDFPKAAFPLQSDGLTFRQIINQKVIPYFSNAASGGFKFYFKSSRADSVFDNPDADLSSVIAAAESDDDANPYDKTTGAESKNILSYLKELAIQKNLVLSTDIFGNLIVNFAYTGNNYLFEIGTGTAKAIPFIDIACNYNGEGLHSQIEVIRQADKNGDNEAYAIIYNPLVPVVFMPRVVKMSSGQNIDVNKVAESELGTELKNIPLKISLPSPVANKKFIMPNNTIRVQDRRSYLYQPSKWFIEEVAYRKNAKEDVCEVTAVLPGVYGGQIINPFILPKQNLPTL